MKMHSMKMGVPKIEWLPKQQKKIGSHKPENKIEPMMDLFASQISKKNAENANANLDVSK